MFEDSALFDAFLTETCSKELAFQLNQAIMTGVSGTPNGMANGPATISIAKDTGQASGTISASNVSNMWQRLHGPSRANSVWFAHQDFDPDTLALPVTSLTGWHGPQPSATLKGRPVWPLEQCPALGTPGDLMLCDPSQYLVTMMGIRKSISAHLRFNYGETYMKVIFRVDGQSLWSQPITPPFGTLTKAPFITIQQR
jgi:HK97 family phage major capsid protein